MELIEKGFGRGLKDCWAVREEDARRRKVAHEEADRLGKKGSIGLMVQAYGSLRDTKLPLWQRISGLTSESVERELEPMQRRAQIRRLLRAADSILRAELTPPKVENPNSAEEQAAIEALKAERSVFWDPLPEMCFYLQIAQAKLAQYSRQLTGLGAKDLADRIRVETLRSQIRERLRKVTGRAQEFSKEDVKRLSSRDGAGVLLKALRASEHFVSRQEMALGVGIASKARLYRACLACERKTLEEIERQEAEAVFAELLEKGVTLVVEPPAVSTPEFVEASPANVEGVKTD